MFNKILVVCMGNICRSPIGEALLKSLLPEKDIRSAGIIVDKSGLGGASADKLSVEIALEHDLDLSHHTATQLTELLCTEADLILVMEQSHIERVSNLCASARSKTLLFGQWSGDGCIDDPYNQDKPAFQLAYQRIEKAAQAWARRLN